jgi:hypothetical protein
MNGSQQLPVISYQLSVISYQELSSISDDQRDQRFKISANPLVSSTLD